MKKNKIHIVCFDIPDPPNYGGVIDMFYKIKHLSAQEVAIDLHCFKYGRKESKVLNSMCENVYYYDRNVAKSGLFNKLPYVVISRNTPDLLNTLTNDESPILFEGLHCCAYLDHPKLKNRIKIVRTHNIEHEYYENLAVVEGNFFKRYYFHNEASKLMQFESILKHADHIMAISQNDTAYFNEKYSNAIYLPAFHPNEKVDINPGIGDFALYHGNLSIGENNQAAMFLVKDVFAKINYPLVIAGSKPTKTLIKEIAKYSNIKLFKDIPTDQIHDLIKKAHINILPTFQPTGIKLKLLSALFNGRHCIVNLPMVQNTGLEELCKVCVDSAEMTKAVLDLAEVKFTNEMMTERQKVLQNDFSNRVNAEKLIGKIFN